MTLKTFAKFSLLIAVAIVCSSLALPSFSAPKKKTTSSVIKVPSSILTGSDITTGRAFKRSNQKEIYLAGLKLGDNALKVLEKYGNPTRVIIHQPIPETNTMGGMPGMSPGMPGMSSPMSPGMPGMGGMPGMMGMGQQQAVAPSFAGTSTRIDENSLCWQYELPAGTNLEFIISKNRIAQITVVGLYPWKYAKLNSGLQLGDTYKLANYVWGIDVSNIQIEGSYLRLDYIEKYGTALTFLNKKLVGITIATGDPIL